MGWYKTNPKNYFTASLDTGFSASSFAAPACTGAAVESATTAVVSATGATVESFASVVADPEPHATSASTAIVAKTNVYFFI